MKPSQINALERVRLEAPEEAAERLVWFYGDLVELTVVDDDSEPGTLCFRSGGVDLRIQLKRDPAIEPVRRRAVISVRSVDALAGLLDEHGIPYSRLTGLDWTDRRLSLLDPGGNRVELKQEWRYGVLGQAEDRPPPPPPAGPPDPKRRENSQKSR